MVPIAEQVVSAVIGGLIGMLSGVIGTQVRVVDRVVEPLRKDSNEIQKTLAKFAAHFESLHSDVQTLKAQQWQLLSGKGE